MYKKQTHFDQIIGVIYIYERGLTHVHGVAMSTLNGVWWWPESHRPSMLFRTYDRAIWRCHNGCGMTGRRPFDFAVYIHAATILILLWIFFLLLLLRLWRDIGRLTFTEWMCTRERAQERARPSGIVLLWCNYTKTHFSRMNRDHKFSHRHTTIACIGSRCIVRRLLFFLLFFLFYHEQAFTLLCSLLFVVVDCHWMPLSYWYPMCPARLSHAPTRICLPRWW